MLGKFPGMRLAKLMEFDLAKAGVDRISRHDPRLILERKRAHGEFRHTQKIFGQRLQDHLGDYTAGRIPRTTAEYRIKRDIREEYRSAFVLGKRTSGNLYSIEPHEERWLRKLRYDEFRYLRGFLDDIDAGRGVIPYRRRMDMYEKAIREVGWMGWLIGNRDRRRRITWRMNPDKEHCATCAAMDGKTWTVESFLAQVRKTGILPQSGSLACLGYRCGCWLEESFIGEAQ